MSWIWCLSHVLCEIMNEIIDFLRNHIFWSLETWTVLQMKFLGADHNRIWPHCYLFPFIQFKSKSLRRKSYYLWRTWLQALKRWSPDFFELRDKLWIIAELQKSAESDAAPEHKGWLGRLGYLMGIMTIEPMMFVQVRSEDIGHDDNDPDKWSSWLWWY